MIFKFITVLVILFSMHSYAENYVSEEHKVSLIELYSSEGCSSCPPAEQQIAKLLKHKDLWKNFVPVNFHVDYWNRLGWIDPYSQKAFTKRQYDYSKIWGVQKVYTPAFVIEARDAGPSLKIPNKIPLKSPIKISVNQQARQFRVKVTGYDKDKQYKVHFAYLGNGLVSKVRSGENQGRELVQNFAVLDFKTQNLKQNELLFKPAKSKAKAKSFSFAVWITNQDGSKIYQSLGAKLKPST